MMSETVVTIDPNRNAQQQQQPKPATAPGNALSWIKFNVGYFQTIPGILKLVQLVSVLVCCLIIKLYFRIIKMII